MEVVLIRAGLRDRGRPAGPIRFLRCDGRSRKAPGPPFADGTATPQNERDLSRRRDQKTQQREVRPGSLIVEAGLPGR
jgi:hypothetical protein